MTFFKKKPEKKTSQNNDEDIASEIFNKLLLIIRDNPNIDSELINYAKEYAKHYHKNQKRKSGEPYYIHTIEVSLILANLIDDQDTIIAALLHDVVEDTKMVLSQIGLIFGSRVSYLVDRLTKLDSGIKKLSLAAHETIDKLTRYKEEDKHVSFVKLADRMHNMRTLSHITSSKKRKRIAEETLRLFVPLANYFKLTSLAKELEFLSYNTLNAIKANKG